MEQDTLTDSVDALRHIVTNIAPDACFRDMYGGEVIALNPENPQTQIGGIFAYTAHVSLGFSKGVNLANPDNILKGSDKLRRHIKLRNRNDVTEKHCRSLLEQAVTNPVQS